MLLKKIKATLLTVAVILASLNLYAQTPGFVQQDVIKVAQITTNTQVNSLPLGNIQTTRVYIDGLGRAVQTVALQASPVNNKDIIQPEAYNALGQQTINYLPYTDNNAVNPIGSFRTTAIADQLGYYQQSGTSTNPNKVANEMNNPYSQQVFENSPLQRVLSSGMVGTGFQPVSGGKYKTISYRLNNAAQDGNILIWSTSAVYTTGNYYADNFLSVTDGTDEDGVETRSFTDAGGKMILKRQLLGSNYVDTYYIYNNGGMISYIIPPKALGVMVSASDYNPDDAPANTLVFKFVYDNLGRLIEKTVPAKGKVSIIYDPLNRPVLMQDALMNSRNQWNYIRYDVKGRAISQGIYTDGNAARLGRSAMQAYVSSPSAGYSTTYYESTNTTQATGYYSANVFPTTGTGTLTPLAYVYYDNYQLNPSGTAYAYAAQGLTNEESATTAPVKGMVTMIRKATVGSSLSGYWLLNVTFYDKRLHPIQSRSNNQINYSLDVLTDNSTNVPDFLGAPQVTYVKKVTANTVAVQTNMTYDNMYRVTAVDQSYNGAAPTRIAAYTYNELGQLVTKNLGQIASGTIPTNLSLATYSSSAPVAIATNSITLSPTFTVPSGSSFSAFISTGYLQTLDIRYNIRGQLTSMNNSKLNSDNGLTNNDATDVFGMQLLYDQSDSGLGNTGYFNGKLSAVKWMSVDNNGNHTNERSYIYTYDQLNRYTGATYGERAGSSTGTAPFSTQSGAFNEAITYSADFSGNIQNLTRSAVIPATGAIAEIDHLTYTYNAANPNQLTSVADINDANHNGAGFRYIAASSGSYGYDVNGNLNADPYKGITNIAYNYLNKTDNITFSSSQYINYIYDGTGNLIRKQQTSGSTVTTTDYIDGFTYNNKSGTETLAYFPMPEGRVLNNSGTLVDEYVIGDQQGNARISFQNNNGVAKVTQENSYYPTGLIMPNSPVATPPVDNKLLYNGGSEWQNDFGNLPDYYQTFNRNYDAAIARWVAVDPMAESAESLTPYQYAGNNPIMFNDPMGNIRRVVDPVAPSTSQFGAPDGMTAYDFQLWSDAAAYAATGGGGSGAAYLGYSVYNAGNVRAGIASTGSLSGAVALLNNYAEANGGIPGDSKNYTYYVYYNSDGTVAHQDAIEGGSGGTRYFNTTPGTLGGTYTVTDEIFGGNQGGWQKFGSPIDYADGTVQNYVLPSSPYSKNAPQFQAIFNGSAGTVKFPGVTITSGTSLPGTGLTYPHGSIVADVTFTLPYLEHEYGHYLDNMARGDVYYIFGIMINSGIDMVIDADGHHGFWTEVEANQMAVKYFGPNSAIAQDPQTFPTTFK